MSDIISFKQQRKAKARTDKDAQASQNRAKFGRTKQEKKRDELNADKLKKHLESHKRDKDEPK